MKKKCNHIIGVFGEGTICTLKDHLWNLKEGNDELPAKYFKFCALCGEELKEIPKK